jgi:predicted transcriptional regulator
VIEKSFCEKFIKKYSTAVRVAVALDLMRRYNMSQFQAAKLVNLPQPLLHYVLHKKRRIRGLEEILSDAAALEKIKKFSDKVARGERIDMCEICMSLRSLGAFRNSRHRPKTIDGYKI